MIYCSQGSCFSVLPAWALHFVRKISFKWQEIFYAVDIEIDTSGTNGGGDLPHRNLQTVKNTVPQTLAAFSAGVAKNPGELSFTAVLKSYLLIHKSYCHEFSYSVCILKICWIIIYTNVFSSSLPK